MSLRNLIYVNGQIIIIEHIYTPYTVLSMKRGPIQYSPLCINNRYYALRASGCTRSSPARCVRKCVHWGYPKIHVLPHIVPYHSLLPCIVPFSSLNAIYPFSLSNPSTILVFSFSSLPVCHCSFLLPWSSSDFQWCCLTSAPPSITSTSLPSSGAASSSSDPSNWTSPSASPLICHPSRSASATSPHCWSTAVREMRAFGLGSAFTFGGREDYKWCCCGTATSGTRGSVKGLLPLFPSLEGCWDVTEVSSFERPWTGGDTEVNPKKREPPRVVDCIDEGDWRLLVRNDRVKIVPTTEDGAKMSSKFWM